MDKKGIICTLKCLLCVFAALLIGVTVVSCTLFCLEKGQSCCSYLLMVVFAVLGAVEITLVVVLRSLVIEEIKTPKEEKQKQSEDKIAELLTKIYEKKQ